MSKTQYIQKTVMVVKSLLMTHKSSLQKSTSAGRNQRKKPFLIIGYSQVLLADAWHSHRVTQHLFNFFPEKYYALTFLPSFGHLHSNCLSMTTLHSRHYIGHHKYLFDSHKYVCMTRYVLIETSDSPSTITVYNN